MTREYITDLAKTFKHPPNWIRTDNGGEAYLKSLNDSYLARPLYPLISAPDRVLYDGNLRLEAILRFAPLKGDTPVQACITGEPFSPAIGLEIQIDSAAHTKGLTDYEQFLGCSGWLALNPDATAKELAARTHLGEAMLCKLLSLSKGIPEVMEAAKAGLLTYSKWHPICTKPAEAQATLLAASLNGATRDQLQSRKNGSVDRTIQRTSPAVRLPSIKIPLANDVATGTVTVAGEGIDLDDAETILKEAIKAIRTAKADNLDSKTAQAVWRNRAKAGL